jgi:hypothetical protein
LGRAEALLLIARTETIINRWQISDGKFNEVIAVLEQLKQPYEIAKAYFYYAETLELASRFMQDEKVKMDATQYFYKSKDIFRKIGAKIWLDRCLKYL